HSSYLSPDGNLSASAVVCAHDRADWFGREIRLKLSPSFDSHFQQVGFADTSFGINLIDGSLPQSVALILPLQLFKAFPRDLNILSGIADILRRQWPPMLICANFLMVGFELFG